MQLLRRFLGRPPAGRTTRQVIKWWELRRLPYNLLVAAFCVIYSIASNGMDSFESIVTTVLVVMSNLWYTGGWIAELLLNRVARDRFLLFGPVMYVVGVIFSFFFCEYWLTIPFYTP